MAIITGLVNLRLAGQPAWGFAPCPLHYSRWRAAKLFAFGTQHFDWMRYRAEDLGLQPNCDTFSLCEQRRSIQKENTPGCVAQPGGWVPCASRLWHPASLYLLHPCSRHHFPAASIDIHVERRSPRRPWRYAREMAAMLGHANGIEDQKQELATSREICVRSAHH
jgi:hypothetical protein